MKFQTFQPNKFFITLLLTKASFVQFSSEEITSNSVENSKIDEKIRLQQTLQFNNEEVMHLGISQSCT